jgi:hypothetical protein
MSIGWVKIHRRLLEKAWYTKTDYAHLWLHLILKATHQPKQFWFNGESMVISSGQFVTGRKKLSAETGIHESKIERILKCFETEQQIEQQKTTVNRLISICNWSEYQDDEQPIEQQTNNKRTTSEQRLNTYKNDKNIKNDKKEGTVALAQPYVIPEAKQKRFIQPELDELKTYFLENRSTALEAEKFYSYYMANGWKVGRNPMKDWKHAVSGWIKRSSDFTSKTSNNGTQTAPAAKTIR